MCRNKIMKKITISLQFQLHKSWLAERAALKKQYLQTFSTNSTSSNIPFDPLYYRRLYKLSKETKLKDSEHIKAPHPYALNKTQLTKKFHASDNDVLPIDDSKETTDTSVQQVTTILLPYSSTSIETILKDNVTEPPRHLHSSTTGEFDATTERREVLSLNTPNADFSNQVTESIKLPPSTTVSKNRRPGSGSVGRSRISRKSKGVWGQWQPWTQCSRSCGGGVMSQSRQCLNR